MFGVSLSELGLILLVAIFFIGPKELPTVIRAFQGFRKKLLELRDEFTSVYKDVLKEMPIDELKQEAQSLNQKLQTIIDLEGNEQEAYDVEEVLKDVEASKKNKPQEPVVDVSPEFRNTQTKDPYVKNTET